MCLLVLQALACHAYAADPVDAAADDSAAVAAMAGPVQTVEITGRGQSRQVQNINKADLAEALRAPAR
jgi:iron complex outermembrane receptor protein